jgi:hypothetical protein
MHFDELMRFFWERPVYQRVFLAFTVGLFLSCSARMAGAQPATDAPVSVQHAWTAAVVESGAGAGGTTTSRVGMADGR